jgi:transcription initiation factor IIF auxiliary subunit
MEVYVRDTAYPGRIDVDPANPEYPRFLVKIYLEGAGLPLVKAATYHLHRTFPDPVRRVARTAQNPSCALEFWAWGSFPVLVEIEDLNGRVVTKTHVLKFTEDPTVRTLAAQVRSGQASA